jgi:glycosyltransferase involved in cell wall biosynthesis
MQRIQGKVKKHGLTDKVRFLGKVPLEDLAAYTTQADIGLVLLENKGLNYYYSLPNRIFDFIQANVPILASDFPEIRKIIAEYPVGKLILDYTPQQLAASIQEILSNSERFRFKEASTDFTWEKESKTILKILENISLDTAKKSHAITVE